MKKFTVEISLKTIAYLLLLGLTIFIVSQILDIIVLVMIAFVLMTALHPLVAKINTITKSRILAVLLVYFLLLGSFVVVGAVLIPPLIDQTVKLLTRLSELDLASFPVLNELTQYHLNPTEIGTLLSQYAGSVGTVLSYVFSTFSVLFSISTVLVMSLYLLLEREHLYRYASILFRTKDRDERSKKLFNAVEEALGGWVRGEFFLMLIIGVLTYIGLSLLSIPYALPLAILAGLLEALPNIGPTLAAIPAIIIASITISPVIGIVTAILYMLIQAAENNFVVPQVMKKAVGISPLTAIVLILMGIRFGGFIGALLVIPIYIVLRVVLQEFSHEISSVLSGHGTQEHSDATP